MPELPEVETILRGITPWVKERTILDLEVREPRLRLPIPVALLHQQMVGKHWHHLERRGRYLLAALPSGWMILHLGMSGSLRMTATPTDWHPHDHWRILFADGVTLYYNDPRRFGLMIWNQGAILDHPLLKALGPEPLSETFDATWLSARGRGRRLALKGLIMDNRVVAGVGNIYATESLFRSGLHPAARADTLDPPTAHRLVVAIKTVIREAIAEGGTTLRNFLQCDGQPGYFRSRLQVYGRERKPCLVCGLAIERMVQGGRSSFYCPVCQPRPNER